jgi:hypothetical protein
LRPYLKIQDGGQMSMKQQATYGKVFFQNLNQNRKGKILLYSLKRNYYVGSLMIIELRYYYYYYYYCCQQTCFVMMCGTEISKLCSNFDLEKIFKRANKAISSVKSHI